jgi:transcriptional regulator with XRE-family HTH domain
MHTNGPRLKAWRENGPGGKRRMTQKQLAEALGYTRGSIVAHWEAGRFRPGESDALAIEALTGGEVLARDWYSREEWERLQTVRAIAAGSDPEAA